MFHVNPMRTFRSRDPTGLGSAQIHTWEACMQARMDRHCKYSTFHWMGSEALCLRAFPSPNPKKYGSPTSFHDLSCDALRLLPLANVWPPHAPLAPVLVTIPPSSAPESLQILPAASPMSSAAERPAEWRPARPPPRWREGLAEGFGRRRGSLRGQRTTMTQLGHSRFFLGTKQSEARGSMHSRMHLSTAPWHQENHSAPKLYELFPDLSLQHWFHHSLQVKATKTKSKEAQEDCIATISVHKYWQNFVGLDNADQWQIRSQCWRPNDLPRLPQIELLWRPPLRFDYNPLCIDPEIPERNSPLSLSTQEILIEFH